MNEIVPQQHAAPGLVDLAGEMVRAGLAPRGLDTPQKLALAMRAGEELGLPPMVAARCMYVIGNRVSPFGDLPAALVFRSGLLEDYQERIEVTGQGETREATAHVTVKRKSYSAITRSFSWTDAKRAGLAGKDTYKQYPADMLLSKARIRAFRAAFPDILLNVVDDIIDDTPAGPVGHTAEAATVNDATAKVEQALFAPSTDETTPTEKQ